jgi:hypothetical protein
MFESFDENASATWSTAWSIYGESTAFVIAPDEGMTDSALLTQGRSSLQARTWAPVVIPADSCVSVDVLADSLVPISVLSRGQRLDSQGPSYYAASVTRGLQIQLVKVIDGQQQVLATLRSKTWLSGQWVRISLTTIADHLYVHVLRHDTGQYLNDRGDWQFGLTYALSVQDSSISQDGFAGISREASHAGRVRIDHFQTAAPSPDLVRDAALEETFTRPEPGGLPAGWRQWSRGGARMRVSTSKSLTESAGLTTWGTPKEDVRSWSQAVPIQNGEIAVSFRRDPGAPLVVFVRGSNLDTETPTYYAVAITSSGQLELKSVLNGAATTLASLAVDDLSGPSWFRLRFEVMASQLRVGLARHGTGQYLNSEGRWDYLPQWCLAVDDATIPQQGFAGVGRLGDGSGSLVFDNFVITMPLESINSSHGDLGQNSAINDELGDRPDQDTPTTTTTTADSFADSRAMTADSFEFGVLNTLIESPLAETALGDFDPEYLSIIGSRASNPTEESTAAVSSTRFEIPQHYSHIRLAQLAYHGTPFGDFERRLLEKSIDLVIANVNYLNVIADISPSTPQFIYSNASNIYRDLLLDWLRFADQHGYDREAAFYHVTQPMRFRGSSASSWPVSWFWNVSLDMGNTIQQLTSQARNRNETWALPKNGEALMIGNTEKFREIHLDLRQPGTNDWRVIFEYVAEVDTNGQPALWKPLDLIQDTTEGFRKTGQVIFDPPRDWSTASPNGSAPLYYVRVRSINGTNPPWAATILGRDYVGSDGKGEGVIPVFDMSADRDGDGYLNDKEYATRAAGKDARFLYESRAFYPAYGENRFATNIANPMFREWIADYAYRYLEKYPKALGIFMDNSISKIGFDQNQIAEPITDYAVRYSELLQYINQRIAPRWVIANVAGGGQAIDHLASKGISFLEEFAIRPLSASYSQFEDVASNLERRLILAEGRSYAILDSLVPNGLMLDPRAQIATLAYYYLLADPEHTLLIFNGGNEPNTAWERHWSPAVEYNVGKPIGSWSVWDSGQDPSDMQKVYKVYARQYENALVLYKPLSYARGVTGTAADHTATTHTLDRTYRPLRADGSLGAPIRTLVLRNGEGAILIPM